MCCAGQALEADFTGVIRQQDVRSHEVDKVILQQIDTNRRGKRGKGKGERRRIAEREPTASAAVTLARQDNLARSMTCWECMLYLEACYLSAHDILTLGAVMCACMLSCLAGCDV